MCGIDRLPASTEGCEHLLLIRDIQVLIDNNDDLGKIILLGNPPRDLQPLPGA